MSVTTADELLRMASGLSDSERAALAAGLIHSLPGPHYDVSDEEVAERRRQLEAGEAEEISFDQLKAGLGL